MYDHAAYDRANKRIKVLKANLTRARNSGDPDKVIVACDKAFAEFDTFPAWPDNWRIWERAKDDALYQKRRAKIDAVSAY